MPDSRAAGPMTASKSCLRRSDLMFAGPVRSTMREAGSDRPQSVKAGPETQAPYANNNLMDIGSKPIRHNWFTNAERRNRRRACRFNRRLIPELMSAAAPFPEVFAQGYDEKCRSCASLHCCLSSCENIGNGECLRPKRRRTSRLRGRAGASVPMRSCYGFAIGRWAVIGAFSTGQVLSGANSESSNYIRIESLPFINRKRQFAFRVS